MQSKYLVDFLFQHCRPQWCWPTPYPMQNRVPVNTKQLYNICTTMDQRLRRWSNIVQMWYKCLVVTGVKNSGGCWGLIRQSWLREDVCCDENLPLYRVPQEGATDCPPHPEGWRPHASWWPNDKTGTDMAIYESWYIAVMWYKHKRQSFFR